MNVGRAPVGINKALESDVLAYRRLAKGFNFYSGLSYTPRFVTLRRMDCGKWKAAGKTYRTRALAELGARKRGLVPLRTRLALSMPSRHGKSLHVMRGAIVVQLMDDSIHASAGGRAYCVTEGEHAGAWSSEPGPGKQATKYRFESVAHAGSTHGGTHSTATINFGGSDND